MALSKYGETVNEKHVNYREPVDDLSAVRCAYTDRRKPNIRIVDKTAFSAISCLHVRYIWLPGARKECWQRAAS